MARSTSPFRYFDSSPEAIRMVVMMCVRYPLSLRNVEDLLFERGIDICHETVRLWWNRFGTLRKFSSVHTSVHNHFAQERHLVSRKSTSRRSGGVAVSHDLDPAWVGLPAPC